MDIINDQIRIFNKKENRLEYYRVTPSSDFWAEHWGTITYEQLDAHKNDPFILQTTRNYLSSGNILEAGCGAGGPLYALHSNYYNAVGIDFAQKTINSIKKIVPEMKILIGDVQQLPFKDSVFDGIWSLGVIEHFKDGYILQIEELIWCLKDGGYVFLSFPYLSPLRRIKGWLSLYQNEDVIQKLDIPFYQYALPSHSVIGYLESLGLTLIEKQPYDGIKCVKDEVPIFKKTFQKIYDYNGPNKYMHFMKRYLDRLFVLFGSHMILLIFKKGENN